MNSRKILLSADTPCDIGNVLKERYAVSLFPLHILLGDQQFIDGVDIHPADIYETWYRDKVLPRTAAINPDEYIQYFTPFLDDGYDVLHISLGSGISSCYQNASIAARMLEDKGTVRVIDSCSLSTGFGLLVCEAGERIKAGMDIDSIVTELEPLALKTRASFVLDTLEFMHAGGRCSGIASMSAELLNIKPTIIVKNDRQGSMTVGKKLFGKIDKVLIKYIEDQLKERDDIVLDRVFLTYSTLAPELVEKLKARTLELQPFKELFVTEASCTIGSHCGPSCFGVLYLTK